MVALFHDWWFFNKKVDYHYMASPPEAHKQIVAIWRENGLNLQELSLLIRLFQLVLVPVIKLLR